MGEVRTKRKLIVWVLLLALILGSLPFVSSEIPAEAAASKKVSVTASVSYDYAYQVLDLINEQRTSRGLSKLAMDKDLLEAAMQRAAENVVSEAVSGEMDHNRPDGSAFYTVNGKSYGENLACGYTTPDAVVNGWMKSEGHKANILNPAYMSIGIGCVYVSAGIYKIFWAQEFGRLPAAAAAKPEDTERTFSVPVSDKNFEKIKKLDPSWNEFINSGSGSGTGSDPDKDTGSGPDTGYDPGNGPSIETGWEKSGNKWYYRDADGRRVSGWVKIASVWYYFSNDGVMSTGWKKVSGKWYYFTPGGKMVTGWKKLSGKWYYLAGSGAMVTGWRKLSGKWYYLAGSGAMVTGWKEISDKWYYLSDSGAMVTGNVRIDGTVYSFKDNGVCTDR